MDIELQSKLREKYKWLNKSVGDNYPYPMFGIECGNGWYGLLDDLCFDIDRVLTGNPELEKNFYVAQIKEKFGGLRFYVYGADDEIMNRINNAEKKSFTICEDCGKKGKEITIRGWIMTLCDACKEKIEKENK